AGRWLLGENWLSGEDEACRGEAGAEREDQEDIARTRSQAVTGFLGLFWDLRRKRPHILSAVPRLFQRLGES
ncbi:MAG: hypothetical protein ACJ8DP_13475, partial [Microvirga sp.]